MHRGVCGGVAVRVRNDSRKAAMTIRAVWGVQVAERLTYGTKPSVGHGRAMTGRAARADELRVNPSTTWYCMTGNALASMVHCKGINTTVMVCQQRKERRFYRKSAGDARKTRKWQRVV
jgi:hypothetical protein